MRPILLIMWTAFQSFILRDYNDLEVAHPQSDSSSTWFLMELEFGYIGFWREGKSGAPGEKPLGAKERSKNKLKPHMASSPGFEPGPHWWAGRRALSLLRHPLLPKLVLAGSKSVNNACSIVCVRKALYKSGTGTRGRVCGDLRLGDARRGTWRHQVWDAGTCGTGTYGTGTRIRQIQGRRGRRMWKLLQKSEVNAISVTFLVNMFWWRQPTLPSLGFLNACLRWLRN